MNIKKSQQGFSIAELVVSAGIIAMISTMVIANFRGSGQRFALENEIERVISVVRETHIVALIGQTVGGARPTGGFGVHFEVCTNDCNYLMYPDMDGDYGYSRVDDGVPVQDIGMLDDEIYISNLFVDGEEVDELDINFVPPQGLIYLNKSDEVEEAEIVLAFPNFSYTKRVVVNSRTGQINSN